MSNRCAWVTADPQYIAYHDTEWGVPLHDDRRLFEMLCLEGAEAGLSWILILRKRENFRVAFENFEPEKLMRYDENKIEALLQNEGIVRSRAKITAFINNAARFLEIQQEFGSFDAYIWGFVEGKPIINQWETVQDVPAESPQSQAMSKALKKRGFKFVGAKVCYAFMQSVGMVNDHTRDCFRHAELATD